MTKCCKQPKIISDHHQRQEITKLAFCLRHM